VNTKVGGLDILVVEDHRLNRILIRDLLVRAGHTVVEAHDVEQALERLLERTPDLVLADLQLPGRGGQSLLEEMKRRAEWAQVPVVAVTAFAMQGDRDRVLALGFHGYFSKPLDTRTFVADLEVVYTHVGRRR
jgi:two-component system cell cycle response regulator DivK